jgi:hypothetical protein
MGYLDALGEAIAAAAAEAEIEWTICHSDGRYLYQFTAVDENGTPSRMLLTPGEFARALGVEWPEPFAA